jgi:hypothetical protein
MSSASSLENAMPEPTRDAPPPPALDLLAWLSSGLPLSLFVDLLDGRGPDSARILHDEPADVSWLGPIQD